MRCHECGPSDETYPWFYAPDPECADIELCFDCHPKCVVPGCGELMTRTGEGCCAMHEAEDNMQEAACA